MVDDATLGVFQRDGLAHSWRIDRAVAETWTSACGLTVTASDLRPGDGAACPSCITALAAALADGSNPRPWR